jgi:hypothetical protein
MLRSHSQPDHSTRLRVRRLWRVLIVWLAIGLLGPLTSHAQQVSNNWSEPSDATQGSIAQMGSFNLLLCDPYQNTYLLWAEQSDNGAAVYLRTDANGDWASARDVLVTPAAVIFSLSADIATPTDMLHLIWADQYLRGNLHYSRVPLAEAAQPRSWTAPQLLAQGIDWSSLKTDSQGAVHVVYGVTDASGVEHTIYHISSTDDGKTWSEPAVAYSVVSALPALIRPELAIDGRDRLHVGISLNSYEYGAYSEVGYVRSDNGGQTWNPYRQVQNVGSTFQGVAWIAPYAFGTDDIHLTWHDPRRMHMWSSDGGQTWREPEEIMPLAAAFGGRNELTQDSAGVLHVATAVGDGVFSASWNGAGWSSPEQIDRRFIDPHGQTIVACQGNQLHIAYYDRTGDNKVWYATRLVNAPVVAQQPVPSPNGSGAQASLPTPTIATTILTPAPENRVPINSTPPGTPNPLQAVVLPFLAAAVVVVVVAVVYVMRGTR